MSKEQIKLLDNRNAGKVCNEFDHNSSSLSVCLSEIEMKFSGGI